MGRLPVAEQLGLRLKVKFALEQTMKAEMRRSGITSALDGSGWSTPIPGRFIPREETRYPLYGRLGGPQYWSGRVREI
jgi:hypothetical protein